MNSLKNLWFLVLLTINTNIVTSQITLDSIFENPGYTYIASPIGAGPFPAVLYNHGGLGTNIGGDLRGTAIALAQAGYIARAEKRMETIPISGHLDEVTEALNTLREDPRTDTNCVCIMGFSRGGLLTLQAGKLYPEKVNTIISMAPAQANGNLNSTIADVSPFDDPILILVATNDLIQDNHVQLAQMAHDSLINGGKNSTHILYPYYDSNGDGLQNTPPDDGHELFWEVQEPYWSDVINFLNTNSCITNGLTSTNQAKSEFIAYPNPFRDRIIIEFTNPKHENHTLTLYDAAGRKEMTVTNITTDQIFLKGNNLTRGLYFFQLHTNNQATLSGSLLIE